MDVEPARIEQIRQTPDGAFVAISADASSVAADLQRLDRRLKVRFAHRARNPFWEIVRENEDGSVDRIRTVQAHQSRLGVWEGLDHRIVRRFEYIDRDGRGGYNLADALEERRREREKRQADARREVQEQAAERLAHEVRKDLGLGPYRGRAFINHKPEGV